MAGGAWTIAASLVVIEELAIRRSITTCGQ